MRLNQGKLAAKYLSKEYTLYPPEKGSYNSKTDDFLFRKLIIFIKSEQVTGYFVQPHQDDIALSAGGLVRDLVFSGVTVKSITVMSHIAGGREHFPFVKKLIEQTHQIDPDLYNKLRDKEDERGLAILGVSGRINLGYLDLPWRTKSGGSTILSPLYPDVFGTRADEDENELKPKIINDLRELVKNDTKAVVFAPVGTGAHLDHLLVRDACLEAFQNDSKVMVILYSDVPYSLHFPKDDQFIMNHSLATVKYSGFQKERIASLYQYPSQIYHLIDQIREWEGTQEVHVPAEEYFFNPVSAKEFLDPVNS
jgi:LmbE family N-acetylglucosaminyl deacetylase